MDRLTLHTVGLGAELGTQVFIILCMLIIRVTAANQTLGATAVFNTHDVTLLEEQNTHVTIGISGALNRSIVMVFNVTGDDIIDIPPDIPLPKGNISKNLSIMINSSGIGHAVLFAQTKPPKMVDVSQAYVRVSAYRSDSMNYVIDVVGWIYFVAWSVSFYPQTFDNWRRKSVIGLHFDYLSLNIVGFFVYSVFNIGLYSITIIQKQYFQRHQFGVNPVQLNDVIFAVHATLACACQCVQCFIYERGDQKISKTARSILSVILMSSIVMVILALTNVVLWLDFLYFFSYVKLFITLIKFIPQAYFNYQRKSTEGWNIGNVLLDFVGGIFSITQMFLLAYNYDDWSSIFGDGTKFGLGLFSIIFDIFFIVQHYILYRKPSYRAIADQAEDKEPFMGPGPSAAYGAVDVY